jgi:hypothetical protein
MMCRCTPRYGVYYATFQLISRLPAAPGHNSPAQSFFAGSVKDLIPVYAGNVEITCASWQELAKQVVWNYENFVLETRA